MQASIPETPLPALKVPPPLENWMITGEFTSFAASITAFIELVPTTFTAGKAKWFSFAIWNTFWRSSPKITPGLTKFNIFDIMFFLNFILILLIIYANLV